MDNLCDILLIPSWLEGMSLSTLEAMACAKPVVAFDCSSFPELIIDGKGGFLPEKDDVNGLVEPIKYLAEDRSVQEKMGQFNREWIFDRFTLPEMEKKYRSLLVIISC